MTDRSAPRRAPRRAAATSRAAQGEATRQAILRAAIELYAEAGFRGTGLMAIGERAGVHHATVLYHFHTGKDLLLAVLHERDRRVRTATADVLRTDGLAGLAQLPAVARADPDHRLWARLFSVLQVENLDADAEVHTYFAQRRAETHAFVVRLIERERERGAIRDDVDPTVTANVVLAFMTGAQIQRELAPAEADLDADYARFTAMLLADLAPRDGATRR